MDNNGEYVSGEYNISFGSNPIKLSELAQIPETITVCTGGTGEEGDELQYETVANPDYAAAQAKIAANEARIAALQAEIEFNNKYLDNLRGLVNDLNEINNMMENTIDSINESFVSQLSNPAIAPMTVKQL